MCLCMSPGASVGEGVNVVWSLGENEGGRVGVDVGVVGVYKC